MPNVFTHIALEYYDEINQSAFVLGVVLEPSSTDNLTNGWYAAEKKRCATFALPMKTTA